MSDTARYSIPPFTRRVFGAAAIVGPLLLLASTIAFMTAGDGINDGTLGGTFSVWACFTLATGLVGVLRLLEPQAPRAAPLLTMCAVAGAAGGTAFSVDAIFTPVFDLGPDALFDTADGADGIAMLAFLPWGWFIPLTLVITGILCWRTDTGPRWSAALLVAAGVLFVAGRPARIEAIAVVTDLVMIAALAPIGWAMLHPREALVPRTSRA